MVGERDFIGTGLAFPMRINARGGIELARREQDVDESILIILSTPVGQRRMRPTFGCAMHDLAFSPNSPTTHGLIRHHVLEALALWEPRINVLNVEVYADREEPALMLIDIDYELRATNDRRNLVYPFYIIPSEE